MSYHLSVPSSPAIILVAGAIYAVSLFAGNLGVVRTRQQPARHRIA
jgi:zinc/manganese transport system permease protein